MASRQLIVSSFRRITHAPSATIPSRTLPLVVTVSASRNLRNFHCTATPLFPVRRRRPASSASPTLHEETHKSSDKDELPPKPMGSRHEAVTDLEQFRKASSALLDKLHASLAPLEPINTRAGATFILVRGMEEGMGEYLLLDLGPVHGQYTIQVDLEQSLVLMSSPISGQVYYVLSASTGDFCGLDDGHALEGLFVRDLIRQIFGVPKL